jgi:hypothetical protein
MTAGTDRGSDVARLPELGLPELGLPVERAGLPDPAAPAATRASDSDREHCARILRAAAGEGLVTLDEADARLALVYAARFRYQLEPLTVDLPDGGRRLLAHTREARAAARGGLARHVVTVAVVAAVLVMLWALSDAPFFWPAWPLGFMALSVVAHARRIRA